MRELFILCCWYMNSKITSFFARGTWSEMFVSLSFKMLDDLTIIYCLSHCILWLSHMLFESFVRPLWFDNMSVFSLQLCSTKALCWPGRWLYHTNTGNRLTCWQQEFTRPSRYMVSTATEKHAVMFTRVVWKYVIRYRGIYAFQELTK